MSKPKEVAFTITPALFAEALRRVEREPRPKFNTFDSSNNHLIVTTWRAAVRGVRQKLGGSPFFRISRIIVFTDKTSRASYTRNYYRSRLNLRATGDAP